MSQSNFPKRFATVIVFLLLLPILIAIFWNPNWVKEDVEKQLQVDESSTVDIDYIEHSFSNPGNVVLHGITIDGDAISGTIEAIEVDLKVPPLFSRQVYIDTIEIRRPDLTIDNVALQKALEEDQDPKDEDSTTEELPQENEPLPIELLLIKSIKLVDANLLEVSEQQLFDIQRLNIAISEIQIIKDFAVIDDTPRVLVDLSIADLKTMGIAMGELQSEIALADDQVLINNLSLLAPDSQLKLKAQLKDVSVQPSAGIQLETLTFELSKFAHLIPNENIKPAGNVGLNGNFALSNVMAEPNELLSLLESDFQLAATDLSIEGIDLNKAIDAIKDSQETSLLDVGGYLLTGPLGLIAGQLLDLGSGSLAMGGETTIPSIEAAATLNQGVLSLGEAALATDDHRVAFSGGVDIANQKFNEFTFAILNSQGCADVKQTLNGDINEPSSAVANTLLDTVLSPITGLVKNVVEQVKDCEPFYSGPVQHPN